MFRKNGLIVRKQLCDQRISSPSCSVQRIFSLKITSNVFFNRFRCFFFLHIFQTKFWFKTIWVQTTCFYFSIFCMIVSYMSFHLQNQKVFFSHSLQVRLCEFSSVKSKIGFFFLTIFAMSVTSTNVLTFVSRTSSSIVSLLSSCISSWCLVH